MYYQPITGIYSKINWREEPKKNLRRVIKMYWNALDPQLKYAVVTLTIVTALAITLTVWFNQISYTPADYLPGTSLIK